MDAELASTLLYTGRFDGFELFNGWKQNCGESGDMTLVCVFDGHGPTGGRTSAWLKRNFLKLFSKYFTTERSIRDVLTDTFAAAEDQLTRAGFDISTRCLGPARTRVGFVEGLFIAGNYYYH